MLEISGEDVLLFSMPVYGGFIPQPCAKMARNLKGSNTPAIIAAVYGNRHYDDALLQMKDILTEQGFYVIEAGGFIAEHSVFPSVASGRPDDKDKAAMKAFAAKCCQLLSIRSLKNYKDISLPGTQGYDGFSYEGDFRKTNNELCIACGACIKVCPAGARNYHCEAYEEVKKDFEKTSLQFSMIPMNFMRNGKADYILTGYWAKKAYEEAKRYGQINIATSSEGDNFSYIPDCSDLEISQDSDYVYMCENNTIYGTKFHCCPNSHGKILVNDISSSFLSEPMNVSDYGMLFGGVQKNLAPAGLVIAIMHKDLISDTVLPNTPTMLQYKIHADKKSLYNTPPTYNIYMVGKVLKWIQSLGGLEKMKEINKRKASILYDYLDSSSLFYGLANTDSRSLMNVTFRTKSDAIDAEFIKQAEKHEIISIKGHRAIGGMRASLYNAMPIEGVQHLVDFMREFEKTGDYYGKE